MEPITLYRRAIRSGRVEMMSEVAVRLSADPTNNNLVDSLVEQIARIEMEKLGEHPSPSERVRICLQGGQSA